MCACSWRYRPILFFRKTFRSDGEICVSMTPFWGFGPFGGYVTETHISPSDRNIFSKKKYGAISPRSGAYVGESNLLLSSIRRRNRYFLKKWPKTGAPSFGEPVLESQNTPEAAKRALFPHWPARTGPWRYRNAARPPPQPRSPPPSRHAPESIKMAQNRSWVDTMCGFL